MSFGQGPFNIGSKGIQGGLPTNNQILLFNTTTNRWEFVDFSSGGQTFARVVKKVDQIVNSITVDQNDNELLVALTINKTYGFLLYILMQSAADADYKYSFAIPAGASGLKSIGTLGAQTASGTGSITGSVGPATDGNIQNIMVMGRVIMGGTAGNLQYKFSQISSKASDTITLQGSYLVVWEELP